MELREYLRMLRRGWPTIVLVTIIGVGLALLYVVVTPKQYVATSSVVISTGNPNGPADLQQGQQWAVSVAPTYAQVITSPKVLGQAGARVGESAAQLQGVVTASSQQTTAFIYIQVRTTSGTKAADIANAVAAAAAAQIPKLSTLSPKRARLIRIAINKTSIPSAPASPNGSRIILIGFAVGLALGLALAIARQALDTKLRSLQDVEAVTRIPMLAVIPRLSGKQRTGVVVRDFPQSSVGENYRVLRTNLARLESGERRSITCAGVAHDREGAQIALNLAWSFANVGWKVLLIDLDLHSEPHPDDGPGAAGVLAGEAEWRQAVRHTSQKNLDVIAPGQAYGNPSDLLGGRNTQLLLRSVEAVYDYVVVHVPPLLTYTDAAVVARITGHTLVTVSARRTRAGDLTNAVGVLRNVQVEPVGLVLAGTRASTNDIVSLHSAHSRTGNTLKSSPLPGIAKPKPTPVARHNGSH